MENCLREFYTKSRTKNYSGVREMPAELKKTCGHCKLEKPLSAFYHNSTKSDYHNGICKECQKEINEKNK
jgi:hypothetical protein